MARSPLKNSGGAWRSPPSPWTGSTTTAATGRVAFEAVIRSSTARKQRFTSLSFSAWWTSKGYLSCMKHQGRLYKADIKIDKTIQEIKIILQSTPVETGRWARVAMAHRSCEWPWSAWWPDSQEYGREKRLGRTKCYEKVSSTRDKQVAFRLSKGTSIQCHSVAIALALMKEVDLTSGQDNRETR